MNQNKIKVKELVKVFGKIKSSDDFDAAKASELDKDEMLAESNQILAINNLDLEIKEGEFFVIMGLSGSGKSTIIRHFNALNKPTSGKVIIDQTEVESLEGQELLDFRRKKISMVFQKFGLLPHLSILDNIQFGLKVRGESKAEQKKKAMYWLKKVGLDGYEKHLPSQLSGGMQQRVGLARALAVDPEILLMDEPFSALDPLIRNQMQDLIIELQQELKKTIIFVTHDLNEAVKVADTMIIIKEGEIVQLGTPKDITENPADNYVKRFVEEALA